MPHRLRYLIAWNHRLCRAVLAVSQGEPPPYVANREALERPGVLAKLRGFVRS